VEVEVVVELKIVRMLELVELVVVALDREIV
jgi:hypothetical protein